MNQKRSIFGALKWIMFNYVFLGILILIGLVIALAPDLLGDVIPRHGTVGKLLTSLNERKIEDSQHTVMTVPDYVRRVVAIGDSTADIMGAIGGDPYIVATDGSPYSGSTQVNGRVELTVDSIKSYEPDVVVAPDSTPPSLVSSLRAAGIPVFIYTKKDSFNDIILATKTMAKIFKHEDPEREFIVSKRNVKKLVEPHEKDKKPVIALYNSSHGVYRSGIIRDMIEKVNGIDGAGNLVIIQNGKDPKIFSDVSWYRDHKTTVDMNQSMGTKADLIRINPDVIFVPTRFIDKMPEHKQDVAAIMNDPDLQNVTAVKKGYVYPIHEMFVMSYSWKAFMAMEQMAKWLYGPSTYEGIVKYKREP